MKITPLIYSENLSCKLLTIGASLILVSLALNFYSMVDCSLKLCEKRERTPKKGLPV